MTEEKNKTSEKEALKEEVSEVKAVEKESVIDSVSNTVSATTPLSKKQRGKRQVLRGQAHIQCTYNNTMVMLSDAQGGVLSWSSSGLLGFKGAKKSTPYAATQVVADVTEKVRKHQLKEIEVFVKGVGSGRESAIRSLANNGFEILSIKDITPIAHNGCRPRRPRRV
ncbi:MAG: 30S ribosomal protein S11 [Candidatus Moraniibacteriota bacterium]|nr:MAG: 30S ribosomal protein S11 [Candidatus Moranbacteria bacterium]